jgi:thioredoxin reductase (NADPH)
MSEQAEIFDLVIVGGGSAGLPAGVYAGRARMKALLFEGLMPGGQAANTHLIENYPGFPDGVAGPDLMAAFRAQAEKFGCELRMQDVERIERATFDGRPGFALTADDGTVVHALAVIVATGTAHRKLGVPGELEFAGRGVSYCATCDGAFFRDQPIAVIGGGDTALDEAQFLTRFASRLYLVHRRDQLRGTKILQERVLGHEKIEVKWDSVVDRIEGDRSGVTHLVLRNVKTGALSELPVNGVFVFIGLDPVNALVRDLVETAPTGQVKVDQTGRTSVPGLWVAGDLRVGSYRQIGVAVGDGITAAIDAEKYVEALKHG